MTKNPARGIAVPARIALVAALIAAGPARLAHGQEAVDLPPQSPLEQIVVTATRMSATLFEANANVSVATRDDIERMHPASIEDTLRTMPGIQFLNYNLPGYNLSRVRINGTDQVLVLVDGVNVTQLGSGIPYPLHFVTDMENIERIEVLRGSAAVLYGSNAKGGVINIITREAAEDYQTRLTVSAGSYDTRNYKLANEGALGDWSYRLNLSRFLQGSTRDADGVKWESNQEYDRGGVMVSRRFGAADEAAQGHLSPLAAHLRAAQRLHQVARLAVQRLLGLREGLEVLADRSVGLLALLLDLVDLHARLLDHLPDRVDEGLDGLLLA